MNTDEIGKLMSEVAPDLVRAAELVAEVWRKFENLSVNINDHESIEKLNSQAEKFSLYTSTISACSKRLDRIAQILTIRRWHLKIAEEHNDANDYTFKKWLVIEFNRDLRKHNLVIKHPASGFPCNLYAIASADGKGRYVLEDRKTKKRTHTSKAFADFMPISLMDDTKD